VSRAKPSFHKPAALKRHKKNISDKKEYCIRTVFQSHTTITEKWFQGMEGTKVKVDGRRHELPTH